MVLRPVLELDQMLFRFRTGRNGMALRLEADFVLGGVGFGTGRNDTTLWHRDSCMPMTMASWPPENEYPPDCSNNELGMKESAARIDKGARGNRSVEIRISDTSEAAPQGGFLI